MDTIDICVPTPLRKTGDPDLSFVVSAVDEIANHLKPGQLVILESTTYPGTVEEIVRSKREAGGLRAGQDFDLAFSPERVDPGNTQWNTRNIPKVVGGVDDASTEVASLLYQQVVDFGGSWSIHGTPSRAWTATTSSGCEILVTASPPGTRIPHVEARHHHGNHRAGRFLSGRVVARKGLRGRGNRAAA